MKKINVIKEKILYIIDLTSVAIGDVLKINGKIHFVNEINTHSIKATYKYTSSIILHEFTIDELKDVYWLGNIYEDYE